MIGKVAVVGSGYMGGGIAQIMAMSGREVILADGSPELATRSRERIIREAADFEERNLFPPGSGERIAAAVSAADSIEAAVADADFVEEAVPELPEIKHQVLSRISAASRDDTIIGSNTSTIAIGTLAESVVRPERFLGVHFSNPAPFIPGVEVIPHDATAPSVVPAVVELLEQCGKTGVPIADVTGFVLNRLQYALFSEAARLVDEGVASAESIDRIARTTFGFRLPFFGPFAIADMAGLDVYEFCYRSLHEAYPDRFTAPVPLTSRVERGDLGVKTGGGFLATPRENLPELIAYRDEAYAAMSALLERLGPANVQY